MSFSFLSRCAGRAALFVAAILVLGSVTSTAAEKPQQAGVAAAIRGNVVLTRPSAKISDRQLQSGDPIFLGDTITSGKASGLQVMLMDETVFSIGPNSDIVIDKIVYDPATGAGKIDVSIAKGVFRFITGKIASQRPEDMSVRLPTPAPGTRTCDGYVRLDEPCDDPRPGCYRIQWLGCRLVK